MPTARLKPIYSDNALVADVDAPLKQNILDLSKRQRIADIHHHHEADHLGRTVEITEGIAHRRRLGMSPAPSPAQADLL
jgi:hypothetical protein